MTTRFMIFISLSSDGTPYLVIRFLTVGELNKQWQQHVFNRLNITPHSPQKVSFNMTRNATIFYHSPWVSPRKSDSTVPEAFAVKYESLPWTKSITGKYMTEQREWLSWRGYYITICGKIGRDWQHKNVCVWAKMDTRWPSACDGSLNKWRARYFFGELKLDLILGRRMWIPLLPTDNGG